jgi:hypothetical protein
VLIEDEFAQENSSVDNCFSISNRRLVEIAGKITSRKCSQSIAIKRSFFEELYN